MCKNGQESGIKRFIFASSSSIYGPSDAPQVTEEHPINPITNYSRDKYFCEKILFEYNHQDFHPVIVRPATLFGISNRIRFDLVVNILTVNGVLEKKIVVHGGKQLRPNLHVKDMVDFYSCLLKSPDDLVGGNAFNIGLENHTVSNLANMVQDTIADKLSFHPEIKTISINDTRSYQINSEKAFKLLGFRPKRSISDGIKTMIDYLVKSNLNSVTDTLKYSNVNQIKDFKFPAF